MVATTTPKFASLKAGTNDATVPDLHFRYSVAKANDIKRAQCVPLTLLSGTFA